MMMLTTVVEQFNTARLRASFLCLALICVPATAALVGTSFDLARRMPRREIYRGVFYESWQGEHGVVHLIEVDLTAPGVDLYLTPLDADAKANGHQYRLDYVRNVARAEGLAVAVNGTMFSSDSYLVPMVGDFATSIDTIVADHEISHLHERDFMLWFDDLLKPHLEITKPARPEVLERAKWAVGTQNLSIQGKETRPNDGRRDKRCALGLDPSSRKLWIGVFQSASARDVRDQLLQTGAHYVMLLDGGDSTSFYLGGRAHRVPHGLRFGGQFPVATVLGIRADPILDPL
jgi:hypothetical protein